MKWSSKVKKYILQVNRISTIDDIHFKILIENTKCLSIKRLRSVARGARKLFKSFPKVS